METKILLISPPFTQLNTPYPAALYLKGFLKEKGYISQFLDIGIETFVRLFSYNGLDGLFKSIGESLHMSKNSRKIWVARDNYCNTVNHVIAYLQNKIPTLATRINSRNFLPEASRFRDIELDESFGYMGIHDQAKYFCTLYIEDLFDLISECCDSKFGINRYAESLASSSISFNDIYSFLQSSPGYIEHIFLNVLKETIDNFKPRLLGFSIPFPGNLTASLRCAQYVKDKYPDIKIVMGGGYVNTELRSMSDVRLFEFTDYLLFDDGEAPLQCLIEHIEGKRNQHELMRCLSLHDGHIKYIDNAECKDYSFTEVNNPDYSDVVVDKYVSFIETANQMHTLWSDGFWNKLTMAHGCYWGKCSFCDTSLDYIKRYDKSSIKALCDKVEALIKQTGQTGFHFTDEAAPPTLMRDFAIEIIRRKLNISWWTNVRFEKSFTADLCHLLSLSGCIAVSGGLEVASDHILTRINKGVTIEQVAKTCRNFRESGIMVHAYLMYGFPGQSDQETIDSLEIVRQMFKAGIINSGFWHKFTMTAHSPIGIEPQKYGVRNVTPQGTFANNDLRHEDKKGAKHDMFTKGLRTSLYNYMQGLGFDLWVNKWFEFKTPRTSIASDYIVGRLFADDSFIPLNSRLVWVGGGYAEHLIDKKGKELCSMQFRLGTMDVDKKQSEFIAKLIRKSDIDNTQYPTMGDIKAYYESLFNDSFELFLYGKTGSMLREAGLLSL